MGRIVGGQIRVALKMKKIFAAEETVVPKGCTSNLRLLLWREQGKL